MTSLLLLAAAVILQPYEHTFTYTADRDHRSVHLAGTFNNWDKAATPMTAQGRTWTHTLKLEPGKHLYKFVLDEETWITDPKAARNETDGGGHTNSVLFLKPPDYAAPASPTDGRLALSALQHLQEPPHVNWDRGRLTLKLRARPGDFNSAAVRANGRLHPMSEVSADELYALYEVQVPWDRKRPFEYFFEIRERGTMAFGTLGIQASGGNRFALDPRTFKPFLVPKWSEGAVFYQIFPDRFANGSKDNDPPNVQPWDANPTWYNRFGGDIAGVESRIPYLKRLGVEAVYFNPVFQSPSNHRYDATDFLKIDPQFGTNEEFGRLTRELTKAGIRTVLDGVFNHTATDFGPFADIVKHGQQSKFVDWFTIRSFPVRVADPPNYAAWFNYPSMPKVNLANPDARRYMLDIPKFWHARADISGWRLDVANEVSMDFWRDFRPAVKALRADNWIVGEVWGDGTPWLKGDQWDSIMGYQFRDAALGFIAEGRMSATSFLDRLMTVYRSYPPQVSRNLMSLLSSHDTPRFITLAGGDGSLAKLGAVAQFGWPGSPSIYYGEELGMEGRQDPDNRRGMNWALAAEGNDILSLYRRLIELRKASPALRTGEPAKVLANDAAELAVFSRTEGPETVYVALNRSNRPQPLSFRVKAGRWIDVLSGDQHSANPQVSFSLHARSAAILLPSNSTYLRIARQGSVSAEAARPPIAKASLKESK